LSCCYFWRRFLSGDYHCNYVILITESLAFFRQVSLVDFLTDTQWSPLFADAHYGILPRFRNFSHHSGCFVGSNTLGTIAAIYLTNLLLQRCEVVKPCLELLAGIPTVVYWLHFYSSPVIAERSPQSAWF